MAHNVCSGTLLNSYILLCNVDMYVSVTRCLCLYVLTCVKICVLSLAFCDVNVILVFQCQSGYYATGTGNTGCTICTAGYECSDASVAPQACPNGQTSDPGATACTPCPAGQICTAGGSTITCIVSRSSGRFSTSTVNSSSFSSTLSTHV